MFDKGITHSTNIKFVDGLNDGLNLTDRMKSIIQMIKADSEITVDDIAETLNISKPTIERDIATLKSKGVLVRIGSKKNGKWIIN